MIVMRFVTAGLAAIVILVTPAIAGKRPAAKRLCAVESFACVARTIMHVGRVAKPAARLGTFSPAAPQDGENCDVGDNAFIC